MLRFKPLCSCGCLGSLVLWKAKSLPALYCRWSSRISLYSPPSVFPSILTKFLIPASYKHHYSRSLPSRCGNHIKYSNNFIKFCGHNVTQSKIKKIRWDMKHFVKHWYFGRRRFVNKNSCLEACVKIANYFRDTIPSEKTS